MLATDFWQDMTRQTLNPGKIVETYTKKTRETTSRPRSSLFTLPLHHIKHKVVPPTCTVFYTPFTIDIQYTYITP